MKAKTKSLMTLLPASDSQIPGCFQIFLDTISWKNQILNVVGFLRQINIDAHI